MTAFDWCVIAAIAVGVFFAVRSTVKRKKKGGCAGCSGCCSACSGCAVTDRPPENKE